MITLKKPKLQISIQKNIQNVREFNKLLNGDDYSETLNNRYCELRDIIYHTNINTAILRK